MNVTPEQLKQLFDGGFISTEDYHAALMEYVKSKYDKEFFNGRSINPDFVRVPLSEDDMASIGCAMYEKPHPEWLHAYLKWKKNHPEHGGAEHELSFEAGYADGVKQTAEMYRPSIDRAIELESRVDEMAMSYHKSTNAIYMRIRKAIDALENGKPEKAEIILLRMLKNAT